MTKSQELAWIDRIIKHYGGSTYLGSWLKDHREGIKRCLEQDLCLDMVGVVEPPGGFPTLPPRKLL